MCVKQSNEGCPLLDRRLPTTPWEKHVGGIRKAPRIVWKLLSIP